MVEVCVEQSVCCAHLPEDNLIVCVPKDVLQMLGQLILSQTLPACTVERSVYNLNICCQVWRLRVVLRFTTNAECLAGVEKLAVSATKPELLTGPVTPVTVKDFAPDEAGSVGPMEIFYVKGWSRSVAAVACLLHAYELPDALEARSVPQLFKS